MFYTASFISDLLGVAVGWGLATLESMWPTFGQAGHSDFASVEQLAEFCCQLMSALSCRDF